MTDGTRYATVERQDKQRDRREKGREKKGERDTMKKKNHDPGIVNVEAVRT